MAEGKNSPAPRPLPPGYKQSDKGEMPYHMINSNQKLTLSQETVRILTEEQTGPSKNAMTAGPNCFTTGYTTNCARN